MHAGWRSASNGQRGSQHFGSASGRGTTSGRGRGTSGARPASDTVQDISVTAIALPSSLGGTATDSELPPSSQLSSDADLADMFDGAAGAGPGPKQRALLLAVSRRGGEVDLFAWPLPQAPARGTDENAKLSRDESDGADAACALGATEGAIHASESASEAAGAMPARSSTSAADALASPPLWLRSLPPPNAGSNVSQIDRQNLWLPVCWLPTSVATAGGHAAEGEADALPDAAVLLTGGHAGAMLAWRVQPTPALVAQLARPACAAPPSPPQSRQELNPPAADSSQASGDTASSTSGPWRRNTASRADSSSSWRGGASAAPLTVTSCRLNAPNGHARMLFTLHARDVVAESCSPAGASHSAEVWTCSLDRQVIAWRLAMTSRSEVGADDGRRFDVTPDLRLEVAQAWACTGAPVTAMCAATVRACVLFMGLGSEMFSSCHMLLWSFELR